MRRRAKKSRISLIEYNETHVRELELNRLDEFSLLKEELAVTWINIDGLHQTEIIEKAGELFNLHPLTLEDI